MDSETGYVIVTTTTDSAAAAAALADAVVEARLAACAQVAPVCSTYRWQGAVEHASEWRLQAKTRGGLADRLCAFIRERHGYDVPELVVTPIVGGHAPYLAWIDEETA